MMDPLESALVKMGSAHMEKLGFNPLFAAGARALVGRIASSFAPKAIKSTIRSTGRAMLKGTAKGAFNVAGSAGQAALGAGKLGVKAAFNPVIGTAGFFATDVGSKLSRSQARYRSF